jgi:hypothetical protein
VRRWAQVGSGAEVFWLLPFPGGTLNTDSVLGSALVVPASPVNSSSPPWLVLLMIAAG